MHVNSNLGAATISRDVAKVALLVGEEVFELLARMEFQQHWDRLYQTCQWATPFQSREFVSTWYQVYQKEYLPILVKAEREGRLTGLLTMATRIPDTGVATLNQKRIRIVGAGQFEAEYQVWLSEKANGETFIKAALAEIRSRFTQGDILFRYIPPQAPLAWLAEDPDWKRSVVVEPFRRPLMDMSDPDLPRLFRKSEFRNKLNRLRKLGDFKFERITDPESFASILKELTIQFDFRQGAMFNKNRFRENPLKAEFLRAMFEQNLLHATVLRVNGEMLASIVAVVGKGWVHLGGINIHTPFYAGYYSPGFVHFMLLGQQLAQEGYAVFDLTPGGDSYKERMATTHDFVYELTVTNSASFRIKRAVKKQLHDGLIKAGKRPMAVELSMQKWLYLLKGRIKGARERGVIPTAMAQLRKAWASDNRQVYRVKPGKGTTQEGAVKVQRNNLGHLLEYDPKGARLTRWEFLEDAMRRFEDGDHCYTWLAEGRLLACAWLRSAKPVEQNGKADLPLNAPEGALVLEGLYCHPAGEAKLGDFLHAIPGTRAGAGERAGQLYVVADKTDKTLCRALASCCSCAHGAGAV